MTDQENSQTPNEINDLGFFDSFLEPAAVELNRFVEEDEEENTKREWNCGYVDAVFAAIHYAKDHNSNLFSTEELLLLNQLIDKLTLNSKRILCRLLFRKHKWMKSDSFKFYIQSKPNQFREELQLKSHHQKVIDLPDGTETKYLIDLVHESVDELIRNDFLCKLSSHASFEECWEIAHQLLSFEQWQLLYISIFNSSSIPSSSSSSKKDFIEFMKKSILSQKTFFGSSLKSKFPSLFLKFMEQESLSNNNRYNSRIPKKSSTSNSSKIIQIVKLNASILVFLKRILRLYQITSNFPSMTTGSTFISTYRMIDNYSPLLTIFQMVKYPNYVINIKLNSSDSGEKSLLFKSQKQFHQWEATTELRVLFEEVYESLVFV
jgi:hypothetical protein